MPIVYRCSRCGFILHVFVKVGQNSYGVPTPSELANQYGGVCPRCGKPLNLKPSLDDIRIYPDKTKIAEVLEEARRIGLRSVVRLVEEYIKVPLTARSEAATVEA